MIKCCTIKFNNKSREYTYLIPDEIDVKKGDFIKVENKDNIYKVIDVKFYQNSSELSFPLSKLKSVEKRISDLQIMLTVKQDFFITYSNNENDLNFDYEINDIIRLNEDINLGIKLDNIKHNYSYIFYSNKVVYDGSNYKVYKDDEFIILSKFENRDTYYMVLLQIPNDFDKKELETLDLSLFKDLVISSKKIIEDNIIATNKLIPHNKIYINNMQKFDKKIF